MGYVKIITYTHVSIEPNDWSTGFANYYKKSSGTPITYTQLGSADTWESGKFFTKNEDAYYSITKTSVTSITSGVTCSSDTIGKFSMVTGSIGVCLGTSTPAGLTGSDSFLLTGAGTIFTGLIPTGGGIILTQSTNIVYYDNAPAGKYIFYLFLFSFIQ